MRILEPKNAFWKGAKKHDVKKVVGSKNVFYKSCWKFYILGGFFFFFDEISKMRILEPKNAFWKGAKKHGVKKSSNQKMSFTKVVRNFYILGGYFFSF